MPNSIGVPISHTHNAGRTATRDVVAGGRDGGGVNGGGSGVWRGGRVGDNGGRRGGGRGGRRGGDGVGGLEAAADQRTAESEGEVGRFDDEGASGDTTGGMAWVTAAMDGDGGSGGGGNGDGGGSSARRSAGRPESCPEWRRRRTRRRRRRRRRQVTLDGRVARGSERVGVNSGWSGTDAHGECGDAYASSLELAPHTRLGRARRLGSEDEERR